MVPESLTVPFCFAMGRSLGGWCGTGGRSLGHRPVCPLKDKAAL